MALFTEPVASDDIESVADKIDLENLISISITDRPVDVWMTYQHKVPLNTPRDVLEMVKHHFTSFYVEYMGVYEVG